VSEPTGPTSARVVRDATPDDAAACAQLYAGYVVGSAATFETVPPDAAEVARRIAAAQERHAWLVLDHDGVRGFAYGSAFRARPAYRWTCETTVYLAPAATGRGGGRLLYGALLARLAGRGLRSATAGVALPNPASEGLHAALGFEPVGTFPRVGWKLGAWRDVAWYRRALGDGPVDAPDGTAPPEPR